MNSKDTEIFKNGVKAYMHANSRVNANKWAKYHQTNNKLLSENKPPLGLQPQNTQPSFQDMLYWIWESGEYAQPPQTNQGDHK